jgi:uncharacterized protein (TIGR02118 family)
VIRRITLLRRDPQLSKDAFCRHWLGHHASLGSQVPGVQGYRLNPIIGVPDDFAWDGMTETWFDSIAVAEAAFQAEPLSSTIRKDMAEFVATATGFFVEEHVIVPMKEM